MRIFIQTMITWRLFVSEIGQHTISLMFWKDTDFDYYVFGFYKDPEIWNETSTFFGQNGTHYRNHLPRVTSDSNRKKEMLAMRQLMLFTGQPLERHQFAARDFQEVFTTPCSLGQEYHYHSHQHYHPHKIIIISPIHCC